MHDYAESVTRTRLVSALDVAHALASELDLDTEDELDDYAVGFIDGFYAGRNITQPSVADLSAAMVALREAVRRRQGPGGPASAPG